MPYRRNLLAEGQYYHLYNRGVNRQPIFFCEPNWAFFIRLIQKYFQPDLVEILAYCLMPTHYHLLVCLHTDGFPQKVMQPFGISYTKAINEQQNRVGPLFQGHFQAAWVDSSAYLLQLSRYIHLNPVRTNLVEHASDWIYSSYRDYIGLRKGTIPHKEMVMSFFSTPGDYREFVESADQDESKDIAHLLLD
jgi:REP element-mobilizing transposase RayT